MTGSKSRGQEKSIGFSACHLTATVLRTIPGPASFKLDIKVLAKVMEIQKWSLSSKISSKRDWHIGADGEPLVTLQSATKLVETLRPKLGFFLRFSDFKRRKYSFSSPIPSMQCCAHVRATYRKQQTPQLWMEGTGEGRGFFCSPKLPYLSTMSQQFCLRL